MKKQLGFLISVLVCSAALSQALTAVAQEKKCEGKPCTGNFDQLIEGPGKMNCFAPCPSSSSTSVTPAAKSKILCRFDCPKEVLVADDAGDCGAFGGTGTCEKASLNATEYPVECGTTFGECIFKFSTPKGMKKVNSCVCKFQT